MLKPRGRLVYFFPTTEEFRECDLPRNERMKLVANSEQSFGKWSRRVSEVFFIRVIG
jgi:tRNA (guanine10-N2)-methyltransferase